MRTNAVSTAISVACFFAIWEVAVRALDLPGWMLPTPSKIFAELAFDAPVYLLNAMATLFTTLAGFFLAFVIGTALAIAIVYSRIVEASIFSLLISFNSIPKIALAPLFVIWLGTGPSAKMWIACTAAFFPVVINTILGLRSVDPEALDLFKSMQGSRLQSLLKIQLPHAMPYIFSGLKVAISFSLVGAIAAEFIASQNGLGSLVLVAQGMFQTDRVFAALIALGVMGMILFYLVDVAERIICPWHVSQRGSGRAAFGGH
jgi:NitT/TauT family transport system permease protein